jgi:hypothetical protein
MWCNGVGKGGQVITPTVAKASVEMEAGIRPKNDALHQGNGFGIYYG